MDADGETIELLTRYAGGENRLSAALTALVRQSNRIGRSLIKSWLAGQALPQGEVRATLQRPVGKPRGVPVGYVDLEFLIDGRLAIWIEAKLGSGLSGPQQLNKYVQALRAVHQLDEAFVVLLAPAASRASFPKTKPIGRRKPGDTGPFFVSWQQVHEQLRQTLETEKDARVRWLGMEVLAYMKKQGLESAPRFLPAHAKALQQIDEAYGALQRVLDDAAENIAHGYRKHEKESLPNKTYPYWDYTYKPTRTGRSTGWRTSTRFMWWVDPPNPEHEICAGVVWHGENGPRSRPADRMWVSEFLAANDDWGKDNIGKEHWLARKMALSAVTKGKGVDAQAAMLSDFVLEAFKRLNAQQETRRSNST